MKLLVYMVYIAMFLVMISANSDVLRQDVSIMKEIDIYVASGF